MKVRRDAGILHLQRDREESDNQWRTYTSQEVLDSDPQLKMAYFALRAEIVAQSIQEETQRVLVEAAKTPNLN